MNCPECNGKQYCPCKNCAKRNAGKVVWEWISGNGPIKCGHCGHVMSVDAWEALEYQQMKEGETC